MMAAMPHDHDHHGSRNETRVFWAMVVTGIFFIVEIVGGIVSGSLALLADAGHMLTDLGALALAWLAFRMAARPTDRRRSYGYHRLQVLAAFVNAFTLVAIVVWIFVEAVNRLATPVPIVAPTMLAVAVAGLGANLISFLILHGADRRNLNIQGATLHVIGDMLGSVAAIAAAAVILLTGWMPIDPILSMVVAVIIMRSAWRLLRKSAHILLEGTPDWLDVGELRGGLISAVPEVLDVHHVHAWSLTAERPLLTLHAMVADNTDYDGVLARIKAFLESEYAIAHSTVQLESEACADEVPAQLTP